MTQRALTFLRRCRSYFVHWYWPAKYEYSVFCFPGSSHWPQTPPQSGRPTSWSSIFCSISHQYLSIWQLRDIVNTEKIIIWNKYLITTPRTRAFLREMFCFSNIIPAHPYFLSLVYWWWQHSNVRIIKWANTSACDLQRSDSTFLKIPSIALCRTISCVMNGPVSPRACIKSLAPTLNQCHLPLLRGLPSAEYKSATSNISQSHSVRNSDIGSLSVKCFLNTIYM